MQRKKFKVTVTREDDGTVLGEAIKFAHNSAVDAGTDILRQHAREHGGYFIREGTVSGRTSDVPTVMRWNREVKTPEQGEVFAALITVEKLDE